MDLKIWDYNQKQFFVILKSKLSESDYSKTFIFSFCRLIYLESARANEANETDFFGTYRTYEEIYDYLEVLRNLNPNSSSIEVIGKSYEGRDLKVLTIGNDSPDKKIVWIDGGTHAREWIGPATAMYMAASIATGNAACREALKSRSPHGRADSCSSEMRKIFSTYEFRIQPIVNPDGYVYSHKEDRLWRKTRSDSGLTPWSLFCRGTDPNRNYDAKWGGEGSSGNPCSQTFAGRHAHSEPEIASLTDYVSKIKKRIAFFLTLHSYSQIMLLPYGHSHDIPAEYPEVEKIALIGAEQFKQRGTEYSVGSAAKILYPASGTASDWAFDQGIKYSYTFELPDTGDHGFLLPQERIKFVGEETWAAVQAMTYALIQ